MRSLTKNVSIVVLLLIGCALSCAVVDREPKKDLEVGAPLIEMSKRSLNTVESLTLRSKILDENRQVFVYLPSGYEYHNARYPVLYVMDAEWLFDLAVAHVRYYSFDEVTDIKMPKMIVVGILHRRGRGLWLGGVVCTWNSSSPWTITKNCNLAPESKVPIAA